MGRVTTKQDSRAGDSGGRVWQIRVEYIPVGSAEEGARGVAFYPYGEDLPPFVCSTLEQVLALVDRIYPRDIQW